MIPQTNPSQKFQFTQLASTPINEDGRDGGRPSKRRIVEGSTDDPIDLEEDDEEGIGDGEGGELWNAKDGSDLGKREVPESVCEFGSIKELRRVVRNGGNNGEYSSFADDELLSDTTTDKCRPEPDHTETRLRWSCRYG